MQFPLSILKKCWFLAGPTASGKSAVALILAERLDAEIISLDSMTLYRGMDIGTAKPSLAERGRVPHHLMDILDPHEEYSVARYLNDARQASQEIVSRGKTPLFVGGTGLYLRSILRGVFQGPPANPEIRQRLEDVAAASDAGALQLHGRLQQVDPITAARLPPQDIRRVIRALEVHEITGQPLSSFHEQEPLPEEHRPRHVYWLSPPRDWLYDRINRRVTKMIEDGLVEEVRQLLALPNPPGKTARQALGYREIIEHLEGKTSLDQAIETIATRTRQFAKRQHTWFRNLVECREVPITGEESSDEITTTLIMLK